MPGTHESEEAEPGKHRLETLTDGVFAIAMTILVFGLHVQRFTGAVSAPELARALLSQWPGLAAFALSLVVLGQFRVSMHTQFRVIRRANHWLVSSGDRLRYGAVSARRANVGNRGRNATQDRMVTGPIDGWMSSCATGTQVARPVRGRGLGIHTA